MIAWSGWGTALKPAYEPITLARKPLEGTVAANALAHGTGAINVDGCRVGSEICGWSGGGSALYEGGLSRDGGESRPVQGRWPANLIHDGSDEVLAGFPNVHPAGQYKKETSPNGAPFNTGKGNGYVTREYADSGSAARFFYCAKASKADRGEGNKHPTVKPTAFMRYLCRLVTPKGGTVLDPFCGSGSTGKAAVAEGFQFVGIELDTEYAKIAELRSAPIPAPSKVERTEEQSLFD